MMKQAYWNPYLAGTALGLVLLASFVVTGRGLGGSGAFKRASAAALHAASPTWAEENPNLASYFSPQRGPMNDWIVFLGLGVAVGGLVGAVTAKRVKVETVRGPRVGRDTRWALAILGGALSGIAAQIARGCTSGQALTGGAQLALGSWIFMFAVFGGAYAVAYFVRKEWI
jgi:hypothetical protein